MFCVVLLSERLARSERKGLFWAGRGSECDGGGCGWELTWSGNWPAYIPCWVVGCGKTRVVRSVSADRPCDDEGEVLEKERVVWKWYPRQNEGEDKRGFLSDIHFGVHAACHAHRS